MLVYQRVRWKKWEWLGKMVKKLGEWCYTGIFW